MLNFIATRLRERKVIRELADLSDRELQDVGIGRGEIATVVRRGTRLDAEPAFATLAPSWAIQNRRSLAA